MKCQKVRRILKFLGIVLREDLEHIFCWIHILMNIFFTECKCCIMCLFHKSTQCIFIVSIISLMFCRSTNISWAFSIANTDIGLENKSLLKKFPRWCTRRERYIKREFPANMKIVLNIQLASLMGKKTLIVVTGEYHHLHSGWRAKFFSTKSLRIPGYLRLTVPPYPGSNSSAGNSMQGDSRDLRGQSSACCVLIPPTFHQPQSQFPAWFGKLENSTALAQEAKNTGFVSYYHTQPKEIFSDIFLEETAHKKGLAREVR